MNCKPGDRAIVIRSNLGNEGRIVLIVEPSPGNHLSPGHCYELAGTTWERGEDFGWVVEAEGAPLNCSRGEPRRVRPFSDRNLRPIRPGDLSQSDVDALYAAPKRTEVV